MYDITETQAHVVYKITDEDSNILYVGKSLNGNFRNRMLSHRLSSTFKDYLRVNLYRCDFQNSADCNIYEQYYIAKHLPPLNKDKPSEIPSVSLPEKDFTAAGWMLTTSPEGLIQLIKERHKELDISLEVFLDVLGMSFLKEHV